MTSMYLSPVANFFAKTGLLLLQFLIGVFNVLTYPVRKISVKAYVFILLAIGLVCPLVLSMEIKTFLLAYAIGVVCFTVGLIIIRAAYKVLNEKAIPKIACMFNSTMGLRLNRVYY